MLTDRTLRCADCGVEFLFSTAEQQFWEERGFRSPPRRCKNCRRKRRDAGQHGAGAGGGEHATGAPRRDDGERPRVVNGPPRESHPATCSACGAETTVPFKPDPARATFCRACYSQRRKS